MSEITVAVPSVGTEAYFTFKEPFNTFISNRFNINAANIKLKVISVIAMRDVIRTDLRDPYTDLYDPAGLTEVQFKLDLKNHVPLISLSFKNEEGVERYIRVPLNYVSEVSTASSIEYLNRLLVIDLGALPRDLDLEVHYQDIQDLIATRLGVQPELKDVTVGDVQLVSPQEHRTRETIRNNSVSVHKTLAIQLKEATESRDQILNRLNDLGIALG